MATNDGTCSSLVATVPLLLLAGIAAAWIIIRRRRSFPRNLPPGLPSVPILGSIPFVSLSRDMHVTLGELSKKYGDIFHIWFGSKLVVVLGSYETVREALLDNAVAMAGRPTETLPGINPNMKGIGEPTYSVQWKYDRNLTFNILKDFGFGKSLMEDLILEEVGELIAHLDTKTGVAFNPCRIMQLSVGNVICSILRGKRFLHDDRKCMQMIEGADKAVEDFVHASMVKFAPILRFLPEIRAALGRHTVHETEFLQQLMKYIVDHKESHVEGDRSDFIHAYLDRTGDEADDESLVYIMKDLFFGGFGTTAGSLRWALVYMANYPDVQKKVQGELDRVLQKGRLPSLRDKADLPYTEATILETLRLSSVAPQLTPHQTIDDVSVAGYSIPKGALILGNLWGINRLPHMWPEPDEMKPERFLSHEDKLLHRPEFTPFSLGRRACPGEIMARQEMFLFFAAILHNYSIERPDGVDKIDEGGITQMDIVPAPYTIVIRKRV